MLVVFDGHSTKSFRIVRIHRTEDDHIVVVAWKDEGLLARHQPITVRQCTQGLMEIINSTEEACACKLDKKSGGN